MTIQERHIVPAQCSVAGRAYSHGPDLEMDVRTRLSLAALWPDTAD